VRTKGGADEAHLGPGPGARLARPGADGGDAILQCEAAEHMEARPPPDLDVANPVRGLGLHELRRDTVERLGIL
jgi:hypothetical protein